VASDSENMSSLKNYLILSNDHMKSMVASFIYKNVNLKKSEYANIEKFINNIDKWSIDTPQHLRGLDYDGFYTFVQSIKNSVNDICKTIPTIILNNKSGINGGGIPKHWNISGVHSRDVHDFISSYYEFSVYKKKRTRQRAGQDIQQDEISSCVRTYRCSVRSGTAAKARSTRCSTSPLYAG
jgi:hypothetical protein